MREENASAPVDVLAVMPAACTFWSMHEWTHVGVVRFSDDCRYVADEFGELIMVPFCGRNEDFQEH